MCVANLSTAQREILDHGSDIRLIGKETVYPKIVSPCLTLQGQLKGEHMNAIVYALPTPLVALEKRASVIPLPRRTKYGLQETLPFEWPRSYGANALSYVAPRTSDQDEFSFEVQPTSRYDLPNVRQWSMRLVHGMVEVINGVRPPSQLNRWITPEVMNLVQARILEKHMPRFIVRSVHVTETDDGVAEISAVFGTPNRSFALAMRLEGLDGRWRATSLMWAM